MCASLNAGLPTSRSTMKRAPPHAARANWSRVRPSALRAASSASPGCWAYRMDVRAKISRSGNYQSKRCCMRAIFPDRETLATHTSDRRVNCDLPHEMAASPPDECPPAQARAAWVDQCPQNPSWVTPSLPHECRLPTQKRYHNH